MGRGERPNKAQRSARGLLFGTRPVGPGPGKVILPYPNLSYPKLEGEMVTTINKMLASHSSFLGSNLYDLQFESSATNPHRQERKYTINVSSDESVVFSFVYEKENLAWGVRIYDADYPVQSETRWRLAAGQRLPLSARDMVAYVRNYFNDYDFVETNFEGRKVARMLSEPCTDPLPIQNLHYHTSLETLTIEEQTNQIKSTYKSLLPLAKLTPEAEKIVSKIISSLVPGQNLLKELHQHIYGEKFLNSSPLLPVRITDN